MSTNESTRSRRLNVQAEYITPERAKALLDGHENVRPLKPRLVQKYARDMRRHKWQDEVAEIKVGANTGKMVDGQHTLHAIIKTGLAQWCKVDYDAADTPEAIAAMDMGMPRSVADSARALGLHKPQITARCKLTTFTLLLPSGLATSISQQIRLEAYGDMREVVDPVFDASRAPGTVDQLYYHQLAAYVRAILCDHDTTHVLEALVKISTGVGMTNERDSALLIHRKRNAQAPRGRPPSWKDVNNREVKRWQSLGPGSREVQRYEYLLASKCLLAWLNGDTLTRAPTVSPTSKDPFPIPGEWRALVE